MGTSNPGPPNCPIIRLGLDGWQISREAQDSHVIDGQILSPSYAEPRLFWSSPALRRIRLRLSTLSVSWLRPVAHLSRKSCLSVAINVCLCVQGWGDCHPAVQRGQEGADSGGAEQGQQLLQEEAAPEPSEEQVPGQGKSERGSVGWMLYRYLSTVQYV